MSETLLHPDGEAAHSDWKSLTDEVQRLHLQRKHQLAFELLRSKLDAEKYKNFIFLNHPIWWSEIRSRSCSLSRRNGGDSDFIRQLWKNKSFMYSFHRHAGPLPCEDAKLVEILDKEYLQLVSQSKAIHWIVKDPKGKPWGLLSINDISLKHKRAEVLLGVLDGAPLGLATAAMLSLFEFYFKSLNFNKLMSYVYVDNQHSLKGTLHLGFKKEGLLRSHVADPATGQLMDVIQTGLLRGEAFNEQNQKLVRRLLAPKPH